MSPLHRHRRSGMIIFVAALVAAGVTACGGPAPDPAATTTPTTAASSAPESSSPATASPKPSGPQASAAPSGDQFPIAITIAGGQVTPNGEKISLPVGKTVVLTVTSDTDDEIHAHTGGDGYELEVKAGVPTTGSFTLTQPGSFEVESHHLEKIIVILNVS